MIKDLFSFNDTFYPIFHTFAQEVGGNTLSSQEYSKRFVYPDDQALVGQEVKKAMETTGPNYTTLLEHRIVYANGGTGYITVRFFIVKDETGKTIKTFGINQDITERKGKEKELKKAKGELQQQLSQLETFN